MNKTILIVILSLFFLGLFSVLGYAFYFEYYYPGSLMDYISIQSIVIIFILHLYYKNNLSKISASLEVSKDIFLKIKRITIKSPFILIPFLYIVVYFFNRNISFVEGLVFFVISISQLILTIVLYVLLIEILLKIKLLNYSLYIGYFSLFLYIFSTKYKIVYLNMINPFISIMTFPVLFLHSKFYLFLLTFTALLILMTLLIYFTYKYFKSL